MLHKDIGFSRKNFIELHKSAHWRSRKIHPSENGPVQLVKIPMLKKVTIPKPHKSEDWIHLSHHLKAWSLVQLAMQTPLRAEERGEHLQRAILSVLRLVAMIDRWTALCTHCVFSINSARSLGDLAGPDTSRRWLHTNALTWLWSLLCAPFFLPDMRLITRQTCGYF